ncbi:hypothetical protein V6N13_065207 [Hibiscus sabdariffa]|uniref:Uncharacterized protein n=1 Tax=Hibiscus sabdariffa TaxID=183260 RepID=A0ABR2QRJ7_9ROSI
MNKLFLLPNLVSALLVLVAVQAHGFVPFDLESEFTQDSEASKFYYESQYVPKLDDEKTSQFSESGFPQEFEYPGVFFESQQVPYEIDAGRKIKPPPPSPAPSPSKEPSPSPTYAPSSSPSEPENTCIYKCSMKCRKIKFPLLQRLCDQVCNTKCILDYSIPIYNCTSRCAESMPNIFESDKNRAALYVKYYCYSKCIKKL